MKKAISRKNIWENLPRPLKRMSGFALSAIPLPIILGRGFRQGIKFINESQGWSREQFKCYQLEQVRRILLLADTKAPFYHDLFLSVGMSPSNFKDLQQITQLPTINRDTVNENLERMLTVSPRMPSVDYITTGGTGGVPLRFYIGAERSQIEYPYLISSWQRIGYQLGMPMAVLRGRIISPDRTGLPYEYDPIFRHHYYSNFHMTDENMGRYLDHIRKIGPCFLHAYPSSVSNLARFMLRNNINPLPNVHGILAESENVYPEQRVMAENVFGCRYFSSYGHTEKLISAAECEHSSNYHVWPTYGYFELLDDKGSPVTTPGAKGEIVGTGFINNIVPFIRYRTGDYATYVGEYCDKCGREMPIIADIHGHNIQENLIAIDGSLITWSAVNMHDDTFDNVRQFQFYQDAPGKAVLKVVPSTSFHDETCQEIQKNLGKKFNSRLQFTIEVVDNICLSTRGKAIFVDQRIPDAEKYHN